jgi:hypothetical protein
MVIMQFKSWELLCNIVKVFSLPNLAPRRATSSRHKITCFSFFRIMRSSVSKSRHSKICRQFLLREKSKVNKFYWILLRNALAINQNARKTPREIYWWIVAVPIVNSLAYMQAQSANIMKCYKNSVNFPVSPIINPICVQERKIR